MKARLKRLEQSWPVKRTLVCPVCLKRFVVYGRESYDPVVDFLLFVWKKGYQGGPYREPPEEIRRIAEHEHEAGEFIVAATGDPWMGEFFRDAERKWSSAELDAPDLSEQALESR